jgi:predicted ester cyclase
MSREAMLEQIRRPVSEDEHARIRELWKQHSLAEDRRDIDGLIATLTEDCLYEVVPTSTVWEGHDGARQFYTELLAAFPDVTFELIQIVIGPQGVSEEALFCGTHRGDWMGLRASGRQVAFSVVIFFPWDPVRRKFRGERVHFDLGSLMTPAASKD